ncbi:Ovarian tumor-like cysteine protease [Balamuthia mandrillaris]
MPPPLPPSSSSPSAPSSPTGGFSFGSTTSSSAPSSTPFGGFSSGSSTTSSLSSSPALSSATGSSALGGLSFGSSTTTPSTSLSLSPSSASSLSPSSAFGGFSFGSTTSSSAPSLPLPSPAPSLSSSPALSSATGSSTLGGFSFGSAVASPSFSFAPSSPTTTTNNASAPTFSFSSSPSSSTPTFSFSSSSSAASGSVTSTTTSSLSSTPSSPSVPFSFGPPASSSSSSSSGGFSFGSSSSPSPSPSGSFSFASPASSSASSSSSSESFSFGASSTSSGGFSFGPSSPSAPASSSSSSGGFSFGSSTTTPSSVSSSTPASSFSFSSATSVSSPSTSTSPSSFSFGSASSSSSAPSSFSFGSAASSPSTTNTPTSFSFSLPSQLTNATLTNNTQQQSKSADTNANILHSSPNAWPVNTTLDAPGILKSVDGNAALTLASEAVALLRTLMNNDNWSEFNYNADTAQSWSSKLKKVVEKGVKDVAGLLQCKSFPVSHRLDRRLWHVVASLSILGGLPEVKRVGARVEVLDTATTNESNNKTKKGIIVGLERKFRSARVLYEEDVQRYNTFSQDQIMEVYEKQNSFGGPRGASDSNNKDQIKSCLLSPKLHNLDKLRALPEVNLQPEAFPAHAHLLEAFKCLFCSPASQSEELKNNHSEHHAWESLRAQLQSIAMLSLSAMLHHPAFVSLTMRSGVLEHILDLALTESVTALVPEKLEEQCESMKARMFNILSSAQWNDLIPFSPFSGLPILLPTTWDSVDIHNMIVTFVGEGDIDRTIFYKPPALTNTGFSFGAAASSSSDGSKEEEKAKDKEGRARADVAVHSSLPMFYFEVLVASSSGRGVEVGLSPATSEQVKASKCNYNNCYSFRGDGVLVHRGSGASSPSSQEEEEGKAETTAVEGGHFGSGDCIGCGWDAEKRAIFFTKNGQLLENATMIVSEEETKDEKQKEKEADQEHELFYFWPVLRLSELGACARVNFGQQPFRFDFNELLRGALGVTASVEAEEEEDQDIPTTEASNSNNAEEASQMPNVTDVTPAPAAIFTSSAPLATSSSLSPSAAAGFLFSSGEPSPSPLKGRASKARAKKLPASRRAAAVAAATSSSAQNNNMNNNAASNNSSSTSSSSSSSSSALAAAASSAPIVGQKLQQQQQKMPQIEPGQWYKVFKNVSEAQKDWKSAMDSTIGKTGIVRAVDTRSNKILLYIYDEELGVGQQWWYPWRLLKKPVKLVHDGHFSLLRVKSFAEVQHRSLTWENNLSRSYATKAVFTLLSHWPKDAEFSLLDQLKDKEAKDGGIDSVKLFRFLRFIAAEFLTDQSRKSLTSNNSRVVLRTVSAKLQEVIRRETELVASSEDKEVQDKNSLSVMLIEYCLSNKFWLAPSLGFGSPASQQLQQPDLNMARWLLRMVYKEGPPAIKDKYRVQIVDLLLQQLLDRTTVSSSAFGGGTAMDAEKTKLCLSILHFLEDILTSDKCLKNEDDGENRSLPNQEVVERLVKKVKDVHGQVSSSLHNFENRNSTECKLFKNLVELLLLFRRGGWYLSKSERQARKRLEAEKAKSQEKEAMKKTGTETETTPSSSQQEASSPSPTLSNQTDEDTSGNSTPSSTSSTASPSPLDIHSETRLMNEQSSNEEKKEEEEEAEEEEDVEDEFADLDWFKRLERASEVAEFILSDYDTNDDNTATNPYEHAPWSLLCRAAMKVDVALYRSHKEDSRILLERQEEKKKKEDEEKKMKEEEKNQEREEQENKTEEEKEKSSANSSDSASPSVPTPPPPPPVSLSLSSTSTSTSAPSTTSAETPNDKTDEKTLKVHIPCAKRLLVVIDKHAPFFSKQQLVFCDSSNNVIKTITPSTLASENPQEATVFTVGDTVLYRVEPLATGFGSSNNSSSSNAFISPFSFSFSGLTNETNSTNNTNDKKEEASDDQNTKEENAANATKAEEKGYGFWVIPVFGDLQKAQRLKPQHSSALTLKQKLIDTRELLERNIKVGGSPSNNKSNRSKSLRALMRKVDAELMDYAQSIADKVSQQRLDMKAHDVVPFLIAPTESDRLVYPSFNELYSLFATSLSSSTEQQKEESKEQEKEKGKEKDEQIATTSTDESERMAEWLLRIRFTFIAKFNRLLWSNSYTWLPYLDFSASSSSSSSDKENDVLLHLIDSSSTSSSTPPLSSTAQQQQQFVHRLANKVLRLRHLLSHKLKMQFYQGITQSRSNSYGQPTIMINRLGMLSEEEKRSLRRSSSSSSPFGSSTTTNSNSAEEEDLDWCIFVQAFHQLNNMPATQLSNSRQAFSVRLTGEGASDAGGPYREVLSMMCHDLQSSSDASSSSAGSAEPRPKLPLFIPCPNAKLALEEVGIGKNRDKFIPKPSSRSPLQLSMYEFLGKVMAIALLGKNPLPLNFPSFVWKPLVGSPTDIEDLKGIDQYCGQCLEDLLHPELVDLDEDNFGDIIFENFTTVLSDGSKVELKEGGEDIDVTLEYVELVTACRLSESKAQIEAIRRGLSSLIPLDVLSLFTWQELEQLVCGKVEIDVAKLRKHTNYKGFNGDSDPVIAMFWEVMEEFSTAERHLFLRFASGRERLPTDESQWRDCLTIAKLYDSDDALPQSATCFFTVKLPNYTSKEIMKKRILLAISNCASIDTDFTV